MTSEKPIDALGTILFLGVPIGIFFLLSTLIFVALAIWPAIASWHTADWVETPCVVTEAEYSTKLFRAGSGPYARTQKARFLHRLVFQYEIDGKKYASSRSHFAQYMYFTLPNDYRPQEGAQDRCYVDPGNPRQATFRRDFTWEEFWLGLIVGPLGMLVSGVLFRVLVKSPQVTGHPQEPNANRAV